MICRGEFEVSLLKQECCLAMVSSSDRHGVGRTGPQDDLGYIKPNQKDDEGLCQHIHGDYL
jgi:hypothetical protein